MPYVAAEVKRQSTTAAHQAVSDMFRVWTGAMPTPPATKRKRTR